MGPPTSRRRHPDEWRPYQKPQTSGCNKRMGHESWSRTSAKRWYPN